MSDLGDRGNIIDTPEEEGDLFSRILEAANDYRPGLHYAMSHFVARDAVELFADLIDRPTCSINRGYRDTWGVCSNCSALVKSEMVVSTATEYLPTRYCPWCGAEVRNGD